MRWTRNLLLGLLLTVVAQAATPIFVLFNGASSPAPLALLTYLTSLEGTGTMLSGQWADHFTAPSGGTYSVYLDQLLPASGATPANVTVNDHVSGNTGMAPAILGIILNTSPTQCGATPTLAQGLAVVNGWLATGGIVQISADTPDPAQNPNCVFTGTGSTFPGVITPGNAYYNTFMYGAGCSAGSPCGGVWYIAQMLKSISAGHKVLFRPLHESNLATSSNWWGTNGTSGPVTNAQFVTLFKQEIDYIRALGVTNILVEYNINNFGGGFSQNDPGPSYHDVVSGDIYGPTTQANVTSTLSNGSAGFTYLQTLNQPMLLAEVGVHSFNPGSVALYTYNNNIWDQAIQAGSGITHLVGTIIWNQTFCLDCQLSALSYMQNDINRSQLPVITN